MSGESNLDILLSSMQPILDTRPFGYATVPATTPIENVADVFATVIEAEGVTLVAPVASLKKLGIEFEGPWAKISLTIHSSLSAVGLTAAVATAFGKADISANVVAGFYHDNFFVQWHRREDAMSVLAAFKR